MTTPSLPSAKHARYLIASVLFTLIIGPMALAQNQTLSAPEALMDKMTGKWVMTGTISKKSVTHDLDIDWVLKRQYIRIHEVSRDKESGNDYEAWIYIVWDRKKDEFAVMWLDNTAATNFSPEGIGHAKPDGDRIPFIFKEADGTGIQTTFAYDRLKDTWFWTIDNLDRSGKKSSFAKLTLTRNPTNALLH